MKSIYIKNGKIQDIFSELKDNLNGTLNSNDNEYYIDINSDFAKGSIEATALDKNTAYIQFDALFNDDVRMSMEWSNDCPIYFTYCFDGAIQHSFGEKGLKKTIKKNQSGVLKSNSSTNTILYFPKNTPIKLSIIRLGLNTVGESENDELINKVKNIFFKTNEDFFNVRPQHFKIIEKIKELNAIKQKGIVRNLLKNRILQIVLEMEIQQHTDSLSLLAQKINSLALHKINDIKKISNFVINYSTEELFTSKSLISKPDLFTNKSQGGFKFINIQKINDILSFIRIERQRI